jgi:twitching motility two-component system response regulator PilH
VGPSQSVLLVEDDRSLRRYLEVVLRRTGYDVQSAADGLEAMRIVLSAPPDIVITDAIMPNLNGHELVRFLRTTASLSRIPVILLSAMEDKESRDPNHRADVYLTKPVAPEDLIEWIKKLTAASKSGN